jgi:aminomethyltransferase
MAGPASDHDLKRTPLYALHQRLGARFAPFAGYDMPIQYPDGIMAEHLWTRAHAGLFDVSHMGPCFLSLAGGALAGDAAHAAIAAVFEPLVTADIAGLKPGEQRYALLLADDGGALDDLMAARPFDEADQGALYVVVNAGTKEADFARIAAHAGERAQLARADDRALLALQGPEAGEVMAALAPEAAGMTFMQVRRTTIAGAECWVSRSGYTGEDGFEILHPAAGAEAFTERLLADPRVRMIGLGARDSLRLEAGLCLYGHDIDTTTSPVEASLAWAVGKPRRERADFPGAPRILAELRDGPARRRVGLRPLGRAPAREGAEIQTPDGVAIGVVTSGGFGPTVNGPVAMGYVAAAHARPGAPVRLIVRGKPLEAEIAPLPFVPHRYKR